MHLTQFVMLNQFKFFRFINCLILVAGLLLWAQPLMADVDTFGSFEALKPPSGSSIDNFLNQNQGKPITTFVGLIVNLLTVVIVIVGLISIVIGGYFYITAGAEASNVAKAKSWVFSALLGITLALTAWLILNTINPNILKEPELNPPPRLNP